MFRKTAVASALLLALVSPKIFALGLGELDMRSALNQPMDAVIELTSATSADMEDIEVSLASLQDHARAGLSKASILAGFRFTLEKNAAGKPVVRISSDELVREPYLEFMLELDWSRGRLLRQYTGLVDPPVTMPVETRPSPVAPVSRAVTPPPVTRAPVARPEAARPPVAAPATVSVAPPPPAGASEYGPIRRNETLWSIAERLRPGSDVSVEQMMLALQRANPHAFEGNNINRLRAGVTLAVPDRDAVLAMSTREARAETRRQYAEWQSRGTQAGAASTPAATGSDAADETAETEQPAVDSAMAEAGPGESRLQLTAPDEDVAGEVEAGSAAPGNNAESASGAQQLALAAEEVAAERAQSQELRSRVGELEGQISTMKRLLELKDDELARLQQSVSGDAGMPAEASSEPEVPAEAEDATAEVMSAETAAETGAETEAETETTTVAKLTDQAAGLVNRLMSNPLLAGLGVLVALLLGGILWATARARSSQGMLDDDLTMERQLAEDAGRDSFRSVPDVPISEAADEEPEVEEEEAPVESMDEESDSDPLTEADVYLAYGRIQQAEDVLLSALQSDPDNADARLKLLEVYHSAGNTAAFDQAAATFHEIQGDQDERWERIAAMGLALSPHNSLYGGKPAVEEGGEFDMDLSGLEEVAPGAGAGTPGTDAEDSNTIEFTLDTADEEDAGEGLLHSDDEMTTKLDLARAYIDMDDKDSARSILGEVIEEGNAEQKEEAESIIARMA
ncbi:MAG: hypothetical protein KJO66_06650 [Gammaproteobacteria bacterium]|nr:hypothetical protein [Gammaproteobacteria bacterium]